MTATYNLTSTLQMFLSGNDWVGEPSSPPLGQGLVTIAALAYEGAFRLPGTEYGASSLTYQQRANIGLNKTTGGLLINGLGDANSNTIGEFSIPTLVKEEGGVFDNLQYAANTQPFINVLDQDTVNDNDFSQGRTITGIYEKGGEIIVNYMSYYDSAPFNTDTTVVKRNASNINASVNDTSGSYKMNGATNAAGWISEIPTEWQTALGGTHITGHSSSTTRTINARMSVGPSAFILDPSSILSPNDPAGGSTIANTPVINYPLANFLGGAPNYNTDDLNLAGTAWNNLSEAGFAFIIPGTDTYMVLGNSGGHVSGVGYKIRSNGFDAVDPNDYDNHYWLYDVNDMAAAKAGSIQPHELVPYAHGVLTIPFGGTGASRNRVTSGAYDATSGLLYLALASADDQPGQVSKQPLITVFTLNGV